jgi:carbonic anhydrase
MKKLIEGLRQFVQTVRHEEKELFARLATAQQPEVLLITCSDSRVAPHLMTQTRPGDLFVIRNAGNIIPPYGHRASGEAASVEYAVTALEVRDIIVCGHSNCGAMRGLLDLAQVAATMPRVNEWLELCQPTRRIVEEQLSQLDDAARLDGAIQINVLAQLNNLRSHPSVVARLDAGDLNLHGWIYDIGSGDVRAFDSDSECGSFVSLNDAPPAATNRFGNARGGYLRAGSRVCCCAR